MLSRVGRGLMEFAGWLQVQRPEIEALAFARAYSIAESESEQDAEYVAGLREAIAAAVDYGLLAIESGDSLGSPPEPLLAQARRAADAGIGLEVVLRKYLAGYLVLGDLAGRALESGEMALNGDDFRQVWRACGLLLDRLMLVVASEYREAANSRHPSAEQRRARLVKMLLAGELWESDELDYPLEGWHVGAIARGSGAKPVLRQLAAQLDRRLLLVQAGNGTVWAWLGGRCPITTAEVKRCIPKPWPGNLSLSLGAPEPGIAGWRLTHLQSKDAAPIALHPEPRLVFYADVTLLAGALKDDVLANSLKRLYLDPLTLERDGGASLRQTLRAYLGSRRSVSSTAALLGKSRQTVTARLRVAEEKIGRSLDSCGSEVETALKLQEIADARVPA
jgi:hypothetical protein